MPAFVPLVSAVLNTEAVSDFTAAETDAVTALIGVAVLVPDPVEVVVVEKAVAVPLARLDIVVLLMVKGLLVARISISDSRYRAKMYKFETEEFRPLVLSSSTVQPAGLTLTVSGTAFTAKECQFWRKDRR